MTKRYKRFNHKTTQDHFVLAARMRSMVRYLQSINKSSEEQIRARIDLEQRTIDHERQGYLFGAKFVSII